MVDSLEKKNQLIKNSILSDLTEPPEHFTMTLFAPLTDDFVFFQNDYLTVINPQNVLWESPVVPRSRKTLEEHIAYIQKNSIRKALVIAEDISFLRQCPSVESLWIIPPYSAEKFDYSPLYDMPNIKQLNCQTVYGPNDSLSADIDYSRISGLTELHLSGKKGHHNVNAVRKLKKLSFAEGQPASKILTDLDVSALVELDLCQAPVRTLAGLENAKCLKVIGISYCRRLEDISALSAIRDSLTVLDIESCGKINDFSVLNELHNLEHLRLCGSNSLPNLDFLRNMPKLETFTFTMNVQNGDLSMCMDIPYVSCRNRKHYNLKDSDLSKTIKE